MVLVLDAPGTILEGWRRPAPAVAAKQPCCGKKTITGLAFSDRGPAHARSHPQAIRSACLLALWEKQAGPDTGPPTGETKSDDAISRPPVPGSGSHGASGCRACAFGGDRPGLCFDPNWYAPHPLATGYYGMGLYEYGVSGSPNGSNVTGLYTNTENLADNFYQGIYGYFRKPGVNDGTYTMATWDVWWRSTYLFDVPVAGTPAPLFLRLHANMWSYAPTWTTGYNEYGQTFVATAAPS